MPICHCVNIDGGGSAWRWWGGDTQHNMLYWNLFELFALRSGGGLKNPSFHLSLHPPTLVPSYPPALVSSQLCALDTSADSIGHVCSDSCTLTLVSPHPCTLSLFCPCTLSPLCPSAFCTLSLLCLAPFHTCALLPLHPPTLVPSCPCALDMSTDSLGHICRIFCGCLQTHWWLYGYRGRPTS